MNALRRLALVMALSAARCDHQAPASGTGNIFGNPAPVGGAAGAPGVAMPGGPASPAAGSVAMARAGTGAAAPGASGAAAPAAGSGSGTMGPGSTTPQGGA